MDTAVAEVANTVTTVDFTSLIDAMVPYFDYINKLLTLNFYALFVLICLDIIQIFRGR